MKDRYTGTDNMLLSPQHPQIKLLTEKENGGVRINPPVGVILGISGKANCQKTHTELSTVIKKKTNLNVQIRGVYVTRTIQGMFQLDGEIPDKYSQTLVRDYPHALGQLLQRLFN